MAVFLSGADVKIRRDFLGPTNKAGHFLDVSQFCFEKNQLQSHETYKMDTENGPPPRFPGSVSCWKVYDLITLCLPQTSAWHLNPEPNFFGGNVFLQNDRC